MMDTNIASHIIRGTRSAVAAHLQARPVADLCVSVITEGELLFGVRRKPDAIRLKESVEAFLTRVQVVPWGRTEAASYGVLRAVLERAGTPLGALDTQIAAHALAIEAILVTNDAAFSHVPGLTIVDWTVA